MTRIAAVGDIHVRESDKGKWVEYFKEVSKAADVLLICGDLTDTGDEAEAQILVERYRAADLDAVLGEVTGFWDEALGAIQQIRQLPGSQPAQREEREPYECQRACQRDARIRERLPPPRGGRVPPRPDVERGSVGRAGRRALRRPAERRGRLRGPLRHRGRPPRRRRGAHARRAPLLPHRRPRGAVVPAPDVRGRLRGTEERREASGGAC